MAFQEVEDARGLRQSLDVILAPGQDGGISFGRDGGRGGGEDVVDVLPELLGCRVLFGIYFTR